MESRIKGALPLAFVLAMAADLSATGAVGAADNDHLWQVGSLAPLLSQTPGTLANDAAGGPSATQDQTAQWFNFRNCFNGFWRNC